MVIVSIVFIAIAFGSLVAGWGKDSGANAFLFVSIGASLIAAGLLIKSFLKERKPRVAAAAKGATQTETGTLGVSPVSGMNLEPKADNTEQLEADLTAIEEGAEDSFPDEEPVVEPALSPAGAGQSDPDVVAEWNRLAGAPVLDSAEDEDQSEEPAPTATKSGSSAKSKAKSKPKAKTAAKAKPTVKTKSSAKPKPKATARPKTAAKPKPTVKPKATTKPKSAAKPKATKPKTTAKPKAAAKPKP